MYKPRIRLDFSNLSDPNFLKIANLIATNIAANSAIFENPDPDIADVANTVTAFSDALAAAGDLGKKNVGLKDATRDTLEQMLYEEGLYVMYIAKGDLNILTISGYPVVKQKMPAHLGSPGMVTLSAGNSSGELLAKFKKPKGTLGITFQITDEPPTDSTIWRSEPSTTSKFVFTGLTPGKQYWVRVIIVGGNKQSAISAISTMFAV